MLLVAAATEKEIRPLKQFFPDVAYLEVLITGIGPVQAAANLSNYLALHGSRIHGVMNIGIGGAYADSGLELLDVCLARQEVFGDFGICMQDAIVNFEPGLSQLNETVLFDNELVADSRSILNIHDQEHKEANFVTVNCCSGTKKRGDYLRDKFAAGCENMEGAAVAMVCRTNNIPCAEIRCISNMVVDRNRAEWVLEEAIDKICKVTELILSEHAGL